MFRLWLKHINFHCCTSAVLSIVFLWPFFFFSKQTAAYGSLPLFGWAVVFLSNMHRCSEVTRVFRVGWSDWELVMSPATTRKKLKKVVMGCSGTRSLRHLSFAKSQCASSLGPTWFPSAALTTWLISTGDCFWIEVFRDKVKKFPQHTWVSLCFL